jgi:hypothetical protein
MYDLKLGQNDHFSQNNHLSLMPHVFNQNEHPSNQCGHFTQVEPFEKQ